MVSIVFGGVKES